MVLWEEEAYTRTDAKGDPVSFVRDDHGTGGTLLD